MRKKTFVSILIICCFTAIVLVSRASTSKTGTAVAVITPFPETGTITVYKYRLFQKVRIGELQWSSITEQKSVEDHTWVEVTLRVKNTTDEFVPFIFWYKGDNGSITGEVRPEDTFETTEICSDRVTGVTPAKKEIALQ